MDETEAVISLSFNVWQLGATAVGAMTVLISAYYVLKDIKRSDPVYFQILLCTAQKYAIMLHT